MHSSIKLIKRKVSKIKTIDFDNFSFGSVFTDHMFECDFIDGEWINPVIKPYEKIELEPSASVIHYGQAVYEGMKSIRIKMIMFGFLDQIKIFLELTSPQRD